MHGHLLHYLICRESRTVEVSETVSEQVQEREVCRKIKGMSAGG